MFKNTSMLIGQLTIITCKASLTTKTMVFTSTRLFLQTILETRMTITWWQLSPTPNQHSNQQFTLTGSQISVTGLKPETMVWVKSACFQVKRTLNSNLFLSKILQLIVVNSSTMIHSKTSSLSLIILGVMSKLTWFSSQKSTTLSRVLLLSLPVNSKTNQLKAPKLKMKHALKKT